MNAPKVILLALYGLSAITTVATIGKHRKPVTPGVAVATLVMAGLMSWLVVLS